MTRLNLLTLLAAAAIILTGCGRNKEFTIHGSISGAGGDTLVIEEMTDQALGSLERIELGKDGVFSYSDTASNPRLLFLHIPSNEYIMMMVLGGEQIRVSAEKGKFNETMRIEGSPQSTLVMEINRKLISGTNKLDSLGLQYAALKDRQNGPDLDRWYQEQFNKLFEEQRNFIVDFIGRHAGEPASLLALSHKFARQSVLIPGKDLELFERVDRELFKKYPKSGLVLDLHRFIQNVRPQIEEARELEKITGVGALPPDISLPDPDGNTIKLSSLKGKVVLLDFWASWCAPCRRENPNLVRAYKRFKSKGFEIYQVSLDKTREDWIAAIGQDSLNWIHVSDLQYWGSPVARQYGVQSIPANFLLGKDGKVAAKNLRGPALEEELSKLLD